MTPDASQPVSNPPRVVVLAGPNGAGKSTTAPAILQGALHVNEFVNADQIAVGLSAFAPETAAWEAGKAMLERVRELAKRRLDFAYETTLASRSFAPWLRRLKNDGYSLHLLFLWLPNPEIAVARVAERVRAGGHDVPKATIRRRHFAGLNNFFELYQPIASTWQILNNSNRGFPTVAVGAERRIDAIYDETVWQQIQAMVRHGI